MKNEIRLFRKLDQNSQNEKFEKLTYGYELCYGMESSKKRWKQILMIDDH